MFGSCWVLFDFWLLGYCLVSGWLVVRFHLVDAGLLIGQCCVLPNDCLFSICLQLPSGSRNAL